MRGAHAPIDAFPRPAGGGSHGGGEWLVSCVVSPGRAVRPFPAGRGRGRPGMGNNSFQAPFPATNELWAHPGVPGAPGTKGRGGRARTSHLQEGALLLSCPHPEAPMLHVLALALTLVAPSFAQDRSAEIEFENQLRELQDQQAKARERAAKEREAREAKEAERVVQSTLDAMADGNPAGEEAVAYLREAGIRVTIAAQQEPAKVVTLSDGTRNLRLSSALPKYPRALAPHIAREAMELKLASMPDSAEREYMIRSSVARAWLELGGERKGLPVIEPIIGYRNAALAEYMAPWVDNRAEMALYRIAQLTGKPELAAIETPQARSAEKAFVEFLLAENDWRRLHP